MLQVISQLLCQLFLLAQLRGWLTKFKIHHQNHKKAGIKDGTLQNLTNRAVFLEYTTARLNVKLESKSTRFYYNIDGFFYLYGKMNKHCSRKGC